jgi:alkyl hydroperoxide reductase subunit AhpC
MCGTFRRFARRTGLFAYLLLFLLPASLAQPPYRFFSWTTENGLPQNSVQALLQTRDGYLWMSTLDGLVRFDGLRFRIFNRQNTPALTTNGFSFFALLEARQGCLWAGTLTGGAIRYCNGTFTSLTVKDGLPNNTVVRIDEDKEGTVWIFTAPGLGKWQNGRLIRVAPEPGSLGYMAGLQPEFAKRNCKIIGLSVDPVSSHGKWATDIEETQGHRVNFPMIGDPELKIAKLYDMLPADAGTTSDGRTAANNATIRTVFVIGPDKKIKLMLVYPMSTGRNFDEVLRVLDSIQLTATHKVATPVNWKHGEDVIIVPAVSDEEAKQKYPGGWKAPRPYLRFVSQPS